MCARDIRGKVFRDWIRSVVLRKFPVSGRHNSRLNFSWPAAVPQFHVAVKSNFVYVLQLNVLRYRPAHAPEKLGWVIDVQLGSQSPAQVTFVDLISKGGLPRPELSGLSRCCRVMLTILPFRCTGPEGLPSTNWLPCWSHQPRKGKAVKLLKAR